MPDYYAILGLTHTCTQEEIRRKYRQLAMRYHPDRNAGDTRAEARFKEIAEAYRILGDSTKRRQFDLANRKKSPFAGKADTFRQNPQKRTKNASPPRATRPSFIRLLRHTLQNHPGTATKRLIRRSRKAVTVISASLQNSAQHIRQRGTGTWQGINRLRGRLASTIANIREVGKKRDSAASSKSSGVKRGRSKGFTQGNRPNSRHYQRGELDIVYTTPLTRAELKKGRKISVRIANGYAKGGYELLDITIPPASRDGQRMRIRGRGHISGRDGKRGDLYLHLEERT